MHGGVFVQSPYLATLVDSGGMLPYPGTQSKQRCKSMPGIDLDSYIRDHSDRDVAIVALRILARFSCLAGNQSIVWRQPMRDLAESAGLPEAPEWNQPRDPRDAAAAPFGSTKEMAGRLFLDIKKVSKALKEGALHEARQELLIVAKSSVGTMGDALTADLTAIREAAADGDAPRLGPLWPAGAPDWFDPATAIQL
jgi:hypothetical protein